MCSPRGLGSALPTRQAVPTWTTLSRCRMAKATSSNFRPSLPGAEEHNERIKKLDYVRSDLSRLNKTWKAEGFTTVAAARADVAARYKAAQGRKLPSNATPIQETVVVIEEGTTMQQLRNLAQRIQETWGFRPLAIYTHLDEGHQRSKTWKPNLHAHMIFDMAGEDGKTIKVLSDKLRQAERKKWEKKEKEAAAREGREPRAFVAPASWSKPSFDFLQDLTAEALGMERGQKSGRKRLEALEYKIAKQEERNAQLIEQNQELTYKSTTLAVTVSELQKVEQRFTIAPDAVTGATPIEIPEPPLLKRDTWAQKTQEAANATQTDNLEALHRQMAADNAATVKANLQLMDLLDKEQAKTAALTVVLQTQHMASRISGEQQRKVGQETHVRCTIDGQQHERRLSDAMLWILQNGIASLKQVCAAVFALVLREDKSQSQSVEQLRGRAR